MQYTILKFMQSLHSPFMDIIANFLSFLGESTIMILIFMLIYYGWSKKKGFGMLSAITTALVTTNAVKAIFRIPRPFMVHEDLLGGRLETATGYSFPSGHTTGASAFFTSFAKTMERRWMIILALILSALVGLSRMYFAVHWPLDVLVGFIIGTAAALLLTKAAERVYQDNAVLLIISSAVAIVTLAAAITFAILLKNGADERAFSDLMKMCALTAGAFAGIVLEKTAASFKECKEIKRTLLNFLIALVGILIIMALKLISADPLVSTLRYLLVGVWAAGIYPIIAVKTGLMERL